jgi:diacylglycerol kinase (ATP)
LAARIRQLNSDARRVLVVANLSAGAGQRQRAIRDLMMDLNERGLKAQVVSDLSKLDALTSRYQSAGELRAIVAAGGDGTIAEVVNRTTPDVPVTVFPTGTANLLANYYQLRADSQSLLRTLSEGVTVQLDCGRANGRIFLLMAGCGFDADVVARLHRRRDGGNITYWTWALPLLQSIRSYPYPDLRIYCETPNGGQTTTLEYRARWAFAVNLPCYAGGLQVTPEASGTDGLLNVATFGKGSLWHGLRYVGLVALGWHQVLADYRTTAVTRARIESSEPVPYQLDGDPGGVLPLDIEVLPQRVTLLVPRERASAGSGGSEARLRAGAR